MPDKLSLSGLLSPAERARGWRGQPSEVSTEQQRPRDHGAVRQASGLLAAQVRWARENSRAELQFLSGIILFAKPLKLQAGPEFG